MICGHTDCNAARVGCDDEELEEDEKEDEEIGMGANDDDVNCDDDDIRRAAIHELEHVRRGDCSLNTLVHLICAMYWFHPLAWIASRQVGLEAERASDDAVLRRADATA